MMFYAIQDLAVLPSTFSLKGIISSQVYTNTVHLWICLKQYSYKYPIVISLGIFYFPALEEIQKPGDISIKVFSFGLNMFIGQHISTDPKWHISFQHRTANRIGTNANKL